IGVIPARYASTRFPGKPFAKIKGKPMLQWVFEAAKNTPSFSEVFVATDDQRIKELAESFNAKVIMTPPEAPSGSDRVWEAVKDLKADIIINVQGDEPLITGEILESLVQAMIKNKDWKMATLGKKLQPQDLENYNTAKVVVNHRSEAMYFSRLPIPFGRVKDFSSSACYKHIGIYGFQKDFLKEFCETPPIEIELLEALEQLRALYLGAKIGVVETTLECMGVDIPSDVEKVEAAMERL
ncbi:MAG: 3-deoxy-manno-octulosonate cytidylyltransferase, partial [Bdellovibrionales bacterium]|nr:3-deoxy-manno-octulosonate cytidylyltransferase [Bdellovibrionales bacterium]